ncbi:hypothetical protein JJB09_12970 [Rhizobium sp. KVB221]|uniref:Uncharacterized protein n=2 Tax=Rhizobium setariae TaxID=2801340 RepID=A0A937CP94_9HYPH|nr:hypothetical protein [Rhizobium setariae]
MTAEELLDYADKIDSARAKAAFNAMGTAENARKELMDKLSKPVAVTEEMRQSVLNRVKKAAAEGLNELKVLQFPVELCTDSGRAINNNEPDWPETLTGVPRQAYEVWRDRLKPAGYSLTAMIVEWPHGMPGDVGFFLGWHRPTPH